MQEPFGVEYGNYLLLVDEKGYPSFYDLGKYPRTSLSQAKIPFPLGDHFRIGLANVFKDETRREYLEVWGLDDRQRHLIDDRRKSSVIRNAPNVCTYCSYTSRTKNSRICVIENGSLYYWSSDGKKRPVPISDLNPGQSNTHADLIKIKAIIKKSPGSRAAKGKCKDQLFIIWKDNRIWAKEWRHNKENQPLAWQKFHDLNNPQKAALTYQLMSWRIRTNNLYGIQELVRLAKDIGEKSHYFNFVFMSASYLPPLETQIKAYENKLKVIIRSKECTKRLINDIDVVFPCMGSSKYFCLVTTDRQKYLLVCPHALLGSAGSLKLTYSQLNRLQSPYLIGEFIIDLDLPERTEYLNARVPIWKNENHYHRQEIRLRHLDKSVSVTRPKIFDI